MSICGDWYVVTVTLALTETGCLGDTDTIKNELIVGVTLPADLLTARSREWHLAERCDVSKVPIPFALSAEIQLIPKESVV